MSEMRKWKYRDVIKFLTLLRKHPLIWDPENPNFRNTYQRELAFDEISFAMNTTNKCIKKKIHTLRSQYLVEYKKLKKENCQKSPWKYFEHLKFLYKHENEKFVFKKKNDSATDNTSVAHSDDDDDDDSETIASNDEWSESDPIAPVPLNSSITEIKNEFETFKPELTQNSLHESTDDPPQKRRRLSNAEDQLTDSGDQTEKSTNLSEDSDYIRDEFTLLGENIAMELRLLRQERTIHDTLKSKIIRAIKEAKYAIYKAKLNTST